MKINYKKSFIAILLLHVFLNVFSEGTKQLNPAFGDKGYLQIFDNNTITRPFMSYAATDNERLYIHICDTSEIIYMGFKQTNNDVYFRLKAPDGSIVMPAQLLPAAGAGRIGNYNQAIAGPMQAGIAGGYNAIVFNPTMTGDYFIEFNPRHPTNINTNKRVFELFDISVSDSLLNIIDGRLYSKEWDVNCMGGSNRFNATMFIYSDDGIVTSIDFNGIQPFGFSIAANRAGVKNTGDQDDDRQSVSGNVNYPQYKIFLTEPDTNCFPLGEFGDVTAPSTVTGCGSNKCINIAVNQTGEIGIYLELNGVPDFQPFTEDLLLNRSVVKGDNCVPWDGRDGLGNIVANNQDIGLRIDYYNGITHLPLYDVENHTNGYTVTLVYPAIANKEPLLFWDDSKLGGSSELFGCASPCHTWSGNWGDKKTINTWWYANIIIDSLSFKNNFIFADANTLKTGNGDDNEDTICANTFPIQLNGEVGGVASQGRWTGGLGTFGDPNNLTTTYTPHPSEIAAGQVQLTIETTDQGSCNAATDFITYNIAPSPVLNAGPDQTLCKNNPEAQLDATFNISGGATWIGGNGTFIPNRDSIKAKYQPTQDELDAGSVVLSLVSTDNGLCVPETTQVTLNYTDSPVVSAGNALSVCSNNPTVNLNGSVSGGASQGFWSGGDGTYNSDSTQLDAQYTLSANEVINGSTTLTLTSSNNGNCIAETDQVTISVYDAPEISTAPSIATCANVDTLSLSSLVNNEDNLTWSGGSGTILTPNQDTSLYALSSGEKVNGVINFTITATKNGCNDVIQNIDAIVDNAPTISTGKTVELLCSNNPQISVNTTYTGGTGVKWITGDGSFLPSIDSDSINYTASPTEVSNGSTIIVSELQGTGTCNAEYDTVELVFLPEPTVVAGNDQTLCKNNSVATLNGFISFATSVEWTGGIGTFTPDRNSLNVQYTPDQTELDNGSVSLQLTGFRNTCFSVTDSLTITYTDSPTVEAGNTQSVCANNADITLNGSISIATGGLWSGGDGNYTNDETDLNAVYSPSQAEINAGTVTLTLTSTGNGNCLEINDQVTFSITPAPTVEAGNNQTVCFNNALATLNGSVNAPASQGIWSGGNGTFSNNNNTTLNANYLPSDSEKSNGSVTLTLTSTDNGNCNAVSDEMTINISPSPTVSNFNDVTVCANNSSVNYNLNLTGATGVDWSDGLGSYSPHDSATSIQYIPSTSEILAGETNLTVTTKGNGLCNAISETRNITITPAPTVNAGADLLMCETENDIQLNGSVTVAGGGIWTTSGTGNFIPNANTLSARYEPSAQDFTNKKVFLTLTSSNNGNCNVVDDEMTLSFSEAPSIEPGANQTVCTNDFPVLLNATGSPAVWSTNGDGNFDDENLLNARYTPGTNDINNGNVTLTITTVPAGSCPTISKNLILTIQNGPELAIENDKRLCANSGSINLNATVNNASTAFWTTTGNGSFTPINGEIGATYSPSISEVSLSDSTYLSFILTSSGNGPCSATIDTLNVVLAPAPTVTAGPDQILCASVNGIQLNGDSTNTLGITWSGSGSFTNSVNDIDPLYIPTAGETTAGLARLIIQSDASTICPSESDTVEVTLVPAPSVVVNDFSICADSSYINLTGTISNSTSEGKWTTNGTGLFSPNHTFTNTEYYPSDADTANGSIEFVLSSTGSTNCPDVTDTLTVTITPAPLVDAGNDITICEDIDSIALSGLSSNNGGVVWSTSGDGTFSQNTQLQNQYFPSTNDRNNGVVILTLTTTGRGSCKEVSDKIIIQFTPAPTIDAGLPRTVCSNNSDVQLTATKSVAKSHIWSSLTGGTFSNDTATVVTYTASSADTANGSTMIYLTSQENGTCKTYTDSIEITYDPTPTILLEDDFTVCADSFSIESIATFSNAGGVSWSTTGTGNFFPDELADTVNYVFSPIDTANGGVSLIAQTTDNKTCLPVYDTLNITIIPAPTVIVNDDFTVCADSSTISLSAQIVNATSGVWNTSGTNSFNPDSTQLNVTYTPSAIDTAAGQITAKFITDITGLCKSASDQVIITITPEAQVFTSPNQSICADQTEINLTPTVYNTQGLKWTSTGTGVFGNVIAQNTTYFPSATDLTNGSVDITLEGEGLNPCLSKEHEFTLTITPIPEVDAGSDVTICADASPGAQLDGSVKNASGILWTSSGTGSFTPNASDSLATYTPSSADTSAGNVTITLSSTGNGACAPVDDNMQISIIPIPVVNAGDDQTVCADFEGAQLQATTSNTNSVIWTTSGTGEFVPNDTVTNPIYEASQSDIDNGGVTISLSSNDGGVCNPVTDNMRLNITPAPTLDVGSDLELCQGTDSVFLGGVFTVATGGEWSTSGTGSFTPSSTSIDAVYLPDANDFANGTIDLIFTTSGNGDCNAVFDDLQITFTPTPPIAAGPDKVVCTNSLPIELEGSGSSGQWSGGLGTYSPNDRTLNAQYTPHPTEVTAGSVELIISTPSNGTCLVNRDTVVITIDQGPSASTSGDEIICTDESTVAISGTVNFALGGVWRTSGSGTFNDSTALNSIYSPSDADYTSGSVVLTLATTGIAPCEEATDQLTLTILPTPTVSAGADQTVCADAPTVNLSGNMTISNTSSWSGGTSSQFGNTADLNTTYTPTATEITSGSVTLILTTTDNGNCNTQRDTVELTILPAPIVNPGSDTALCTTTQSLTLNGQVTNAGSGIWSTNGTGIFSPANTDLNASYFPSASDTASGPIIISLESQQNGICQSVTETFEISFVSPPTINAGDDEDICTNQNVVPLSSTLQGIANGVRWRSFGTGTFTPNDSSQNVSYQVTQADFDAGSINIEVSTISDGTCPSEVDFMTINIFDAPSATVNAGFDQAICLDEDTVNLNGFVTIAAGGIWTTTAGAGDFYPTNTDLETVYLTNDTDKGNGFVYLTLTSTGNGICAPVSDSVRIDFTPLPTIEAGDSVDICVDSPGAQLDGAVTIATGGMWMATGTGTFSPNEFELDAIYTPSAEDKNNGIVGFTITSTGNGRCQPVTDNTIVEINEKPIVDAGIDEVICSSESSINLDGKITLASGGIWTSSGNGNFNNDSTNLSSSYNISASDLSNGVFNLTLTSTGNNGCQPVTDLKIVTIQENPILVAGVDQTICADLDTYKLVAQSNVNITQWSTLGSGRFTPNINTLGASYLPSATDTANGSVQLILTGFDDFGACTQNSDTVTLTINPKPIVGVGNTTFCLSSSQGAVLNGNVLHAEGGTWSTSGTGSFSPSSDSTSTSYFPSNADINNGGVTLTLNSRNAGTCNVVSSSSFMSIDPMPIANAGPDQKTCEGSDITLSAQSSQDVDYIWENATGTLISTSEIIKFTANNSDLYVLTVTDKSNCVSVDTVNVETWTLPTFNLDDHYCYTNTIEVDSDPSNIPLVPAIFQWSKDGDLLIGKNATILYPLGPGEYSIEFVSGNCSVTDSTSITALPVVFTLNEVNCEDSTVTITTTDIDQATYEWTESGNVLGSTNVINTVTNIDTTWYFVEVTDTLNCTTLDSMKVVGVPTPILLLEDSTSCNGIELTLTIEPQNINQFSGHNLNYSWRQNGNSISTGESNITITDAALYEGTVTVGQCITIDSSNIVVNPNPERELPNEKDFCSETNESVILNAGDASSFVWLPTAETTQEIEVFEAGTYVVTKTNEFNCSVVDSTTIEDLCPPRIFVADAFTPGIGDIHDKFYISGKHFTDFEIKVFNRWGEIIFYSQDPEDAWDGNYLDKNMPSGIYTYIIYYRGKNKYDDGIKQLEGTITLIR